jgi:hypothetical protein
MDLDRRMAAAAQDVIEHDRQLATLQRRAAALRVHADAVRRRSHEIVRQSQAMLAGRRRLRGPLVSLDPGHLFVDSGV